MYSNTIKRLIDCLKELPGIGEKSAERLAFSMLEFDPEKLDLFSTTLKDVKNIKKCSICNNYTDSDICSICSDKNRSDETIFVVEKSKDISLFEKMNTYQGKYHVLGGLISPLNGINPEDINLDMLIERVKKNHVKEVIVVLKPSIEGETTMQYINKILEKYNVKVSKIPIGIPLGTEIEYIDPLTLELAFENRKEVS